MTGYGPDHVTYEEALRREKAKQPPLPPVTRPPCHICGGRKCGQACLSGFTTAESYDYAQELRAGAVTGGRE